MTSRAHTHSETEDVFYNQIVNEEMETEIVFQTQMLDYLSVPSRVFIEQLFAFGRFEVVSLALAFGTGGWNILSDLCVPD